MGLFDKVPISRNGCVNVLTALLTEYTGSASPLPAPDSPLPAPDSPLPAPDSPLPAPDSPLPAPDSPLPAPDLPLPAPDLPLPEPEEKGVNNLLIHITLADEAAYFIETLKLKLVENYFESYPFRVYDNSANMADKKSLKITLLVNGVAPESKDKAGNVRMVPTAVALEAYLCKAVTKPDLIINAGTCGGFEYNNAKIGDAILVTESFVSDSFIPISFYIGPTLIEPYKKYATDNIALTKLSMLAKELKLIEGACGTGNSLDYVARDLERLQANGAFAKDMELYALAWMCQYNKIPLISVKTVTDIVELEDPVGQQFMDNLAAAAKSLNVNLIKIIDYIEKNRNLLEREEEMNNEAPVINEDTKKDEEMQKEMERDEEMKKEAAFINKEKEEKKELGDDLFEGM
jgi:5'-methylthioadenosine nucleosidase